MCGILITQLFIEHPKVKLYGLQNTFLSLMQTTQQPGHCASDEVQLVHLFDNTIGLYWLHNQLTGASYLYLFCQYLLHVENKCDLKNNYSQSVLKSQLYYQ